MDHQQAVAAELPERYAFGEMPNGERDEFEEHLADCQRCLEDVKLAQTFAANARAVLRDEARASTAVATGSKQAWFSWWRGGRAMLFSGGLNLALGVAALYAFFGIVPLLRLQVEALQAPAVSAAFVLQGATRGTPAVYPVPLHSAANFRLDLPKRFDRYQCAIENAAGVSEKTYNLRGIENTETLNLTIPVAGLKPGDYKVRLSGSQGSETERLASFVLRVMPGN